MAYEIHLERDEPFSEAEWKDAVGAEAELDLRGGSFAVVRNPTTGEPIRIPASPLDALGEEVCFSFRPEGVSFRVGGFGPGSGLRVLALRLARRLGARVVGDEGEVYSETTSEG